MSADVWSGSGSGFSPDEDAVFKVAGVGAAAGPVIGAVAGGEIVLEFALVALAVGPGVDAGAGADVVHEVALVDVAARPGI